MVAGHPAASDQAHERSEPRNGAGGGPGDAENEPNHHRGSSKGCVVGVGFSSRGAEHPNSTVRNTVTSHPRLGTHQRSGGGVSQSISEVCSDTPWHGGCERNLYSPKDGRIL